MKSRLLVLLLCQFVLQLNFSIFGFNKDQNEDTNFTNINPQETKSLITVMVSAVWMPRFKAALAQVDDKRAMIAAIRVKLSSPQYKLDSKTESALREQEFVNEKGEFIKPEVLKMLVSPEIIKQFNLLDSASPAAATSTSRTTT
ncbi:MAG TPA: hypothetical protein VJ201_06960 [Candidatus Babeliales bacterium]|nr:hypothetical protein [Candidatus Babeliales bacterium]